jgi:hypothetical protein
MDGCIPFPCSSRKKVTSQLQEWHIQPRNAVTGQQQQRPEETLQPQQQPKT